jgi:hypothetical protein
MPDPHATEHHMANRFKNRLPNLKCQIFGHNWAGSPEFRQVPGGYESGFFVCSRCGVELEEEPSDA